MSEEGLAGFIAPRGETKKTKRDKGRMRQQGSSELVGESMINRCPRHLARNKTAGQLFVHVGAVIFSWPITAAALVSRLFLLPTDSSIKDTHSPFDLLLVPGKNNLLPE